MRGKRGNIVQVYPAVEYDFVPNNLTVKSSTTSLVHIQWTGSNTHQNGAPGGDGQTGNDGQGREATDRSNLVQTSSLNDNYPLPFEMSSLWTDLDLVAYVSGRGDLSDVDSSAYLSLAKSSDNIRRDLALYLASSGYYRCVKASTCGNASYESLVAAGSPLDPDLNAAPASLPGALVKFTRPNTIYYFMCSRNNNFSNRSQKGAFIVV